MIKNSITTAPGAVSVLRLPVAFAAAEGIWTKRADIKLAGTVVVDPKEAGSASAKGDSAAATCKATDPMQKDFVLAGVDILGHWIQAWSWTGECSSIPEQHFLFQTQMNWMWQVHLIPSQELAPQGNPNSATVNLSGGHVRSGRYFQDGDRGGGRGSEYDINQSRHRWPSICLRGKSGRAQFWRHLQCSWCWGVCFRHG